MDTFDLVLATIACFSLALICLAILWDQGDSMSSIMEYTEEELENLKNGKCPDGCCNMFEDDDITINVEKGLDYEDA